MTQEVYEIEKNYIAFVAKTDKITFQYSLETHWWQTDAHWINSDFRKSIDDMTICHDNISIKSTIKYKEIT